ncbi:dehydrogenase [Microbacterium sp. X-17]|uniref:dehydrogenase n=1 Tax=Microbacterium sp. X-17 TaxID=3144404 RepID=UPI0031F5D904
MASSGKRASGKKGKAPKEPLVFRNPALTDALQTQDMAAVAFALRHGPTVVPLMRPGQRDDPRDSGEVWTYRDPDTQQVALLLFSDAAHKPASLPPAVSLQSPGWLRAFLSTHGDEITTVFFDIAGPHPMQATPADVVTALDA